MKTFRDIALIRKIYKNPVSTIGQRNYELLSSYYLGFDFYRQIINLADLEKYYDTTPSIEDYINKKYDVTIGTASWTRPLQYYCEDERELFDEAIKHIFEYEKLFPFKRNLSPVFSPKQNDNEIELLNLLGTIGYRPNLFFGHSKLACLRAFLDGYFDFKEHYKIPITSFEKKTLSFINKYRNIKTDLRKYKTWDRNFCWKIGHLGFYRAQEEFAIPRFLFELEKYTQTKIRPIVNSKQLDINWDDQNS